MGFGSTVVAVLAACVAGIAGFFAFANRATRRIHAGFGPTDVEAALKCVLDDSGWHDEFDLFLTWPIDDPYLESIRKRCHDILQTPVTPKCGEDISEEAKEQIRKILRDLDGRTQPHVSNHSH